MFVAADDDPRADGGFANDERSMLLGYLAVHVGQRVSALAAAGEILVSRTVVDLVAGSEFDFLDRGEHELRGIPGRWQLYAVT